MGSDTNDEILGLKARIAALQTELDDYRERFCLVVESANDGIWDWDIRSNALYNSPRWKETLGYQDDELEPSVETWSSKVHPDDLPWVMDELKAHLAGKTPVYRAEYRLRAKSGEYIWILDRGKAMFDEKGQPKRIAGSLTDITERKLAEDRLAESEQRLRTILNCMTEGILVLDGQGKFVYSNPSFSRVLGLSVDQVEGRTPLDPKWRVIHEDGSPYPGDTHPSWQTLKTGKPIHNDIQGVYTNDDHLNWILANSEPMFRKDSQEISGVVVTFTDITERKQAELELALIAQVFENSHEAIAIADAERRILRVNRSFVEINGYQSEQAMGRNLLFNRAPLGNAAETDEIWQTLAHSGHWQGEIWRRGRDGHDYPGQTSISTVRNRQGLLTHYICVTIDVTERKAAEARIENLAYFDALTDLPNRTLLQDRLHQALALARRGNSAVAVMMIDLDRFKNINDSLGHLTGDVILQQAAKRLRESVREADTISRMGGDEFVAVLLDASSGTAREVASRVLKAFASSFNVDGHQLSITPSIGISLFPSDGQDPDTLIKHADAAMYASKESGRNTYRFFTRELNARVTEHIVLESGLRRALAEQAFELHYQPQIDTARQTLIGAEALLRWRDPGLGDVSPVRFIPVAEETGLIVPIGRWVIQQACRQARRWRDQGLELPRLAINLSARQFRDAELVETAARALRENALPPGFIEFELTESSLMDDALQGSHRLHELRNLGAELAIDDFGTGYSSLSYLKQFRIQRLKIDRSFVRDLSEEPDDAAIVTAVIGLAHSLRIDVIAEGVETEQQMRRLRDLGCSAAQGYLFSTPLTAAGFADLLADWSHQSLAKT